VAAVSSLSYARLWSTDDHPVQKKITNADRAYYALLTLPMVRSVFIAEKIKISKTLIWLVATHRAESWTMNTDIAKWLDAFEKKILRRMCVEIKVNENRRKQYSKELIQMFTDLDTFNCQNKSVELD